VLHVPPQCGDLARKSMGNVHAFRRPNTALLHRPHLYVDLCSSILSMGVGKFHTSVYSTAMNNDQGRAGKKRCG